MPLAVISGGTKGIGKAICHKFASKGFNVATNARNTKSLSELSAELSAMFPSTQNICSSCDMTRKEDVHVFVEKVQEKIGIPDVLINNVGVFKAESLCDSETGLEDMMQACLFSTHYFTKAFLPLMVKRGSGHIFLNCSVASSKTFPSCSTYCVAKAAQLAYARCLREELKGRNIRVTAILPGATVTDSFAHVPELYHRMMPSEDIAELFWNTYALSSKTVVEEIIVRPISGDISDNDI